jgi:hypothetical protein
LNFAVEIAIAIAIDFFLPLNFKNTYLSVQIR